MGIERERKQTMEKNKEHVDYFIEPIGSETNDRLFRNVFQNREEDVCEQLMCTDGVARNLVRVSDKELAMCIINCRTSELTFHAFKQTEKGIERIYIVFEDDIEDALKGRISLDEAKVTYEDIAQRLPAMPLIPQLKKVLSYPGAAPFNAKQRRRKKVHPVRFSNR